MDDLIKNINRVHTTPMGEIRIKRNINLENNDIIEWSKNAIEKSDLIMRLGKNWYVYVNGIVMTINAKSYTIITMHKICGKVRVMQEYDYPCLKEFLYQAFLFQME